MKAQATVLTVQIGSALLPVLSGLVNIVGQAITFVGNLAVEFYNAIGGAAGLNQIAATLIKTMVVLGAVTAGVFLATNLTAFASALRGVVGVMRTMLTLERAMLAIETARVAVIGLIAGVKSGRTPASAIIGGAAGGLLAGGALMLGLSKLIDGITKQIGDGLGKAFTMPNIPDAVVGTTPDLSGLDTSKIKTPKTPKIKEDISPAMLTLEKELLQAQKESNQIQEADIKLQIEYLRYEEEKTKTRRGLLEVLKAERTFAEEIGEIGTKAGQDAAADLIKRMELQEKYNTTVEDLRIKAGLVTGEELKQLNINREIKQILDTLPDATQGMIDKVTELVTAAANLKKSFDQAFGEAFQDGIKSMGDLAGNLGSSFASAFQGMADQLTEFVTTGKANFREFAVSVLKDISRMIIQYAIFNAVKGIMNAFNPAATALGSSASNVAQYAPLNAKGNVFAQNGIQAFARGGIVNKPTVFPFANGVGLMGEAGPEAIMPLRRGRDGNLGVMSSGGGTTNVTVNVDASGSSVEGDEQEGKQLGRLIGAAIQQELVKQKRPGGLLA
jgi:lambda family phage tail tape measure protein